jgi:hypothetical protein
VCDYPWDAHNVYALYLVLKIECDKIFYWNFELGVASLSCLVAKSNEFAMGFIGEEPAGWLA